MEEELTVLILDDANVSSFVGDRVHWLRQPQSVKVFPHLNLQVISDPRSYHMKGPSGVVKTRIQADVRAETYGTAKQTMRALYARLSGFKGLRGSIEFMGIFVSAGRDLNEETAESERQLFRISADLEISWKETGV
ncbi:tail completion protein gp17 [Roseovarius sp. B08]|uniref:tail completion protein gp17 n=1 Tax=Roseovarius sp. B08 TaxID=3449223 RepID=UPI003EDC6256